MVDCLSRHEAARWLIVDSTVRGAALPLAAPFLGLIYDSAARDGRRIRVISVDGFYTASASSDVDFVDDEPFLSLRARYERDDVLTPARSVSVGAKS